MLPILFHIGSIPVHSFGVMVLIGFGLGLWYATAAARRLMAGHKPDEPGVITPDHVFDMAMAALFVCIVGARILYVLLDLNEFRGHWVEVFKVWTGGISVHGAIISGILFLWWYCHRHKLDYLKFADLCAPAFALGYAIGRIGCFLNGCCYGYKCDLPWAVRFVTDEHTGVLTPPSHPTQLYATLMNLVIFFVLDRWSRRPHKRGAIFLGFLSLYCVYRFIDEQFRKNATADVFFWGLTHAQWFSLAMLPLLLFLLWRLYHPAVPAAESADPTLTART